MTRLVPHPLLSLVLMLVWLLLTRLSPGNLVLGLAVGLLAGWSFARLEPEGKRLRSLRPLLRLMAIVSQDILRSNLAVARLILRGGQHGRRHSAFVEIPLRLTDPAPLALLAMVITATPGTAWIAYDKDSGILLLHVFDMVEGSDWSRLIRDRYEALLLEAFA